MHVVKAHSKLTNDIKDRKILNLKIVGMSRTKMNLMIYTIIVIEKLIMKMSQYENNEQQSEDIVARNSN